MIENTIWSNSFALFSLNFNLNSFPCSNFTQGNFHVKRISSFGPAWSKTQRLPEVGHDPRCSLGCQSCHSQHNRWHHRRGRSSSRLCILRSCSSARITQDLQFRHEAIHRRNQGQSSRSTNEGVCPKARRTQGWCRCAGRIQSSCTAICFGSL